MLCYARMRYFTLIAISVGLLPLRAQLVIDQPPGYEGLSVYGETVIQPAEVPEEPAEPERPVYSGDPALIDVACDADSLLQAGLNCSEASPCGLEFELLLAEDLGERIVVAGSVRTAAGTLESVLLTSADGGGSWTEPVDRVAAGALEIAQFLDGEVGWIGGQRTVDGAVSEPFLLFTKDGGEDFDQRFVVAGGETQEGFILQLQFDSPDHGYLILEKPNAAVDRFRLYESYNGGRSWAIRQIVAERPAIPGARRRPRALLDPDLRLTAQNGVIELERRAGGAWARLAGFQIEIGSCPLPPAPSETQ